jgi:hypothetical protein
MEEVFLVVLQVLLGGARWRDPILYVLVVSVTLVH